MILVGRYRRHEQPICPCARGRDRRRQPSRHYENARFPSFQDAIEAYVAEVGSRPTAGVVAIAGPVAGEIVGPTNLPRWRFRPPSLASALSLLAPRGDQ